MLVNIAPNRDLRLDFFRGLSLFIILIDHMRGNVLVDWTPGAFGYSDAAAVFIFISGVTAARAFGTLYARTSWFAASARVALRVWQLYVAQLGVVILVAALPGLALHLFHIDGYTSILKLDYLFGSPVEAFWGIVTLTYVPAYLDVLPVYIAMMAMIPLAMLLARRGPALLMALSCALWVAARLLHWNLPADPSDGRGWFFDPFAWQFLFFTGFSLGMGWLHLPRLRGWQVAVAVALLALAALVRSPPAMLPNLAGVHSWAEAQIDKTYLDPLGYMHFFLLVAVVVWLMPHSPRWLRALPVRPFVVAGQQSLAVFLGTILLADVGAMAFDLVGTGAMQQTIVTLGALACLSLLGFTIAWFKAAPWKRPAKLPEAKPAAGLEPL